MPATAREAAVQIVRTLRGAGHTAYLAGGCVRDMLLGLTPKDYDIATDAKPEQVRGLFRGSRYVGETFGVVLVRLLGHEIQVATFRTEWGYEDGRRPTRVEFTDAQHDALRRDFTINGLFEDPLAPDDRPDARVIDFVGGRQDLLRRVVRAIGDPHERFAEDFLRLLRAVRFAARLGFAIEEETAAAIRAQAPNLSRISRERIGQEVAWMLTAATRAVAAGTIQRLGLDAPALQEEHRDLDLPTLAALPAAAALPVALAAWLLDRHLAPGPREESTDELAVRVAAFVAHDARGVLGNWRAALCLSNEVRDLAHAILGLLPRLLSWARLDVATRKRLLADPACAPARLVLGAWEHHAGVRPVVAALDADGLALEQDGIGLAPRPLLTGEDLISLRRKPGPDFKRILEAAYDQQLDGRLKNREQALDWLGRQP